MINFFRKIRKKLADDNKPLKYARYAIGEIVLVVIGILIALSINNWNEDRKDQLRLMNHYVELLNELNNDIDNLKLAIENVRKINNQTFEISEFINFSQSKIDTTKIVDALFGAEPYAFFSISNSVYTTLLSNGDIQLIENEQLKNALSIYHDGKSWDWIAHNGNLKDAIERYSYYVHKFLPPLLFRDIYIKGFSKNLKNEKFNTYITNKKPKIEWERLKNDEEFGTIISQLISYRVFQLNFYNKQLHNINKMIDLIQTELK
jgi:hypothetical protein